MESLIYELKIPKERVAVLIGKSGQTKKEIEEATKTSLEIDSAEGDIFIKAKDGLCIYTAKEIITAIGRGFNPEVALLLLKFDYLFEVINITEYTGKSKDDLTRIKGRIIGRDGKTRELIEELAEVYVSVYGKTVAIIGANESVSIAHQAVKMLIEGSTHSTVYSWLEKKRRELKRKDIIGEDEAWRKTNLE
jgi:ribosomal RNA assembly protein